MFQICGSIRVGQFTSPFTRYCHLRPCKYFISVWCFIGGYKIAAWYVSGHDYSSSLKCATGSVNYSGTIKLTFTTLTRASLYSSRPQWPAMLVPWLKPGYSSELWQTSLQWHHNGRDSVSNHQPRECLLSRLIRCRSKKSSKVRVTGLCAGNSPETGEFPAQRASDAENVSIWWRHHSNISLEVVQPLDDNQKKNMKYSVKLELWNRNRVPCLMHVCSIYCRPIFPPCFIN